jgi:hypothetical protein
MRNYNLDKFEQYTHELPTDLSVDEVYFDNEIDFFNLSPMAHNDDFSNDHSEIMDIDEKTSLKSESLVTDGCENDYKMEDSNGAAERQAKKSSHHNFQKHTVTALKDLVKENRFHILC